MSISLRAWMLRAIPAGCFLAIASLAFAQQAKPAPQAIVPGAASPIPSSWSTAPAAQTGAQSAQLAPPRVPQELAADELTTIPHPDPAAPQVDPVPLVAAATSASAATADEQLTQEQLLERLKTTEARVKQLEANQGLLRESATRDMLRTMRERWDTAKDPSITTVDQQTYKPADKKASDKKWYDRLSIRGYAQFRWNEIVDLEPGSAPAQYDGDRSIGEDQNFLIRRARVIISGDVSDSLYVYLQPDFASTPNGSVDQIQFTQIRDWYGDWYLTENKVHRIRVGQSKVPYGWENMQSSSNRLALDRADALNSAVRNERDLGAFYYWTPEPAQDFFKEVLDMGLKGSGNYGVFGFGLYNGQGGSLAEQNDDVHFVTRLTVPWKLSDGQMMEFGVQGYMGKYTVLSSQIRPNGVGGPFTPANTLENGGRPGVNDERIAGTFVWYPQPLGFQAEWNVGRGPALNAAQTAVEERALYGGYLQTMYKIDTRCHGTIFPFIRWVYYEGGLKADRNAPYANIDEWEFGTEWQITPQTELTTTYLITDRTNSTAFNTPGAISYQQFEGSVMRFQFQINY